MCGRPLDARSGWYRPWLAALPIVVVVLGLLGFNAYQAYSWRTAVARPPIPPASPLGSTPTASPKPTATPTPTSVPTLAATSVSFSHTLLEERFEQSQNGALETGQAEGVSYTIAQGAYVVAVDKPNYIAWSPINGNYTDAAAQVDVTFGTDLRDTAAGVVFRYQDANNFYFFNISADGRYALDLLRNGSWSPVIDWTTSPQIRRPGTANRLRVEMLGEQISLYLNGTLLDQASDPTFSSGRMALAVNTFAQSGVTVAFDNLVVQGAE